jgi:hypothetical protein
MRIFRGNRSTRSKPAPVPLCPPQISHELTWVWTRAAAVRSRRLTAWAMVRPLCSSCKLCNSLHKGSSTRQNRAAGCLQDARLCKVLVMCFTVKLTTEASMLSQSFDGNYRRTWRMRNLSSSGNDACRNVMCYLSSVYIALATFNCTLPCERSAFTVTYGVPFCVSVIEQVHSWFNRTH